VIEGLLAAGHSVRGLSRKMPDGGRRRSGAEYVDGVDVGDRSTMTAKMFEGVDVVVHLVGIIQESGKSQTFRRIHVDGTRNVVDTAKAAGFGSLPPNDGGARPAPSAPNNGGTRFIYMSAIGTEKDAPAEYSRTKWEAEQIVIESGLPYTIFRPSLVMGRDGEFVAQMAELIKHGGLPFKAPVPVIPVPGSGLNKFQPIYVDDLISCVVKSIEDRSTIGQTYEVGGATQVSFNELLAGFARSLKIKKPMVHAPVAILKIVATVMEAIMPKPPVTRDQLANLGRDNVTQSRAITEVFGVTPLGFDVMLSRIYD
jgi:NADH dehydrogenase